MALGPLGPGPWPCATARPLVQGRAPGCTWQGPKLGGPCGTDHNPDPLYRAGPQAQWDLGPNFVAQYLTLSPVDL